MKGSFVYGSFLKHLYNTYSPRAGVLNRRSNDPLGVRGKASRVRYLGAKHYYFVEFLI